MGQFTVKYQPGNDMQEKYARATLWAKCKSTTQVHWHLRGEYHKGVNIDGSIYLYMLERFCFPKVRREKNPITSTFNKMDLSISVDQV